MATASGSVGGESLEMASSTAQTIEERALGAKVI